MEKHLLEACEKRIGYKFLNDFWLTKALTHSSNKSQNRPSNERLEFLGDSVLGMAVSEYLFSRYRDRSEGHLTKIKSIVVSRATLARRTAEMGLDGFMSVGKGMMESEPLPVSVMANVMEAIIGAIFIDGGVEPARRFILDTLECEIEKAVEDHNLGNFKSMLQQLAQREFSSTPTYRVIGDSGPDHEKSFHVLTMIGDKPYEAAWGRSKKEAEQHAAQLTYMMLMNGSMLEFDASFDAAVDL